MVDVIGILGLSIAVFDQLLKAGERAHQLLTDVKEFNQDATRFQRDIVGENNSNKLLRRILFEPLPVYGGRTLFEQFPIEVQQDIRLDFVETENAVDECIKILERRYGPVVKNAQCTPLSGHTRESGYVQENNNNNDCGNGYTTSNDSDGGKLSRPNSRPETPLLRSSHSPSGSETNLSVKSKKDYLDRSPMWLKKGVLLTQWSFHDKKRVGEVIKRFVSLNQRVHGKIKLCSLAGSIGLDLHHLQRLKEDPTSINLGFSVDASLKLLREEVFYESETLRDKSDDDWWSGAQTIGQYFAFSQWKGKHILIETHDYRHRLPETIVKTIEDRFAKSDLQTDVDEQSIGDDGIDTLDKRTMEEVNRLASLLKQPKEQIFRVPRCLGWKFRPKERSIDFAFEIGVETQGLPISLLSLLGRDLKLSLNDKLKLAFALATSLAQLQMARWVHESFRSENILFWSTTDMTTDPDSLENELDYGQPWVLGFEYSRPDTGFSGGLADVNPGRDIYRHPERQGVPDARFTKMHDIYALGIVLLEIALWEPALTLAADVPDKPGSGRARARFLKQAKQRVKSRMGEKYRDIVIKCLTGEFEHADDFKDDLLLQQDFRSQVVDVLRKALENL